MGEEKCEAKGCNTTLADNVVAYSKSHFDGKMFCYACQSQSPDAFEALEKAKQKKPEEKRKTESKGKSSEKWQDDMVNFETLLTKAHALKRPFSIETQCIEIDLEKKYALFKAIVTVKTFNKKEGEYEVTFEAHGDSTSENITGEFIKPHFIRMAESRAVVRALRWYTNAGCAEEEK